VVVAVAAVRLTVVLALEVLAAAVLVARLQPQQQEA
jgi:hypothetical protein